MHKEAVESFTPPPTESAFAPLSRAWIRLVTFTVQ